MGRTPDDESLVEACRAGDRDALGALLDRYEKRVFNVAYRMVQDREDARDVTQTVFFKVLDNLDRFDPRYRFFNWIYRIAIHESIDLVQRRKRTVSMVVDRPDRAPGPEDVAENDEASRLVVQALQDLQPDHRAVIVLRHFLQCSYAAIGEVLEIPEKTVKSRLFTARRTLRKTLRAKGLTHP